MNSFYIMKKTQVEAFPAFIELFQENARISEFYAESRKDYKDKLFELIEKHELYHEWIDTNTFKKEGRLNVTLKMVESFRVCSRETWENRKALYESKKGGNAK